MFAIASRPGHYIRMLVYMDQHLSYLSRLAHEKVSIGEGKLGMDPFKLLGAFGPRESTKLPRFAKVAGKYNLHKCNFLT